MHLSSTTPKNKEQTLKILRLFNQEPGPDLIVRIFIPNVAVQKPMTIAIVIILWYHPLRLVYQSV